MVKTSFVSILTAVFLFVMFVTAFAEDDASGWRVCNLNDSLYNTSQCITKVFNWANDGVEPPTYNPQTESQAISVYDWAITRVSECTSVGAGGLLLPESYVRLCPDYLPTETPTGSPTTTPTPTQTATLTPTPTETLLPTPDATKPTLLLTKYVYLPIVGACRWQNQEGFNDCRN